LKIKPSVWLAVEVDENGRSGLFRGKYEKSLAPKVKDYVQFKADEKYIQETGQRQVDRSSQLWKSLRNVEVLKYDRGLWNTVQQSPTQQQGNVMQTVVEQPRDARDNILTSPVGTAPEGTKSHTGHGVPEKVETGTRAIGEGVRPTIPTNTGHDKIEQPAVTNVFEWSTDYRKNYEQAYGPIPAGHQIHHVTPRAVFQRNALTQEWARRGITKLDYPENLQALPQTKDAYDKSNIKIQHSGSHDIWSTHATEVLADKQQELERVYGSLDKVPDDVMEKTKDDVLEQLREDLLDKDLGSDKGWVVPKDNGMDKLSHSQLSEQIG
jgi:A nuclease family of the HNH/ENDO VII superfamily with conserved AHH